MADATNIASTPVAEAQVNPLDAQKDSAKSENIDLIKNIVSTESGENTEKLIDMPDFDETLIEKSTPGELEEALGDAKPKKSILLIFLKIFFALSFGAVAASLLFFTSQLTDKFDFVNNLGSTPAGGPGFVTIPNLSKEVASTNDQLVAVQTDLNFYRYLQTKAYLDQISFNGDAFIRDFDTTQSLSVSANEKKQARGRMVTLRKSISEAFIAARDEIDKSFTVDLPSATVYATDAEISAAIASGKTAEDAEKAAKAVALQPVFEQKLKEKFTGQAQVYAQTMKEKDPKMDAKAYQDAVTNYKNNVYAMNLVGNRELQNIIITADIDAMTDEDLSNTLKKVNSLIVNDLSIIQKVKAARIKWTDIINEIDARTVAVDTYYNKDLYNESGGIRYTSYNFDSRGEKVSITGETKRIDATNFTMIANLIEELNRSELFKDAGMKSFSKSGSPDDTYTASINITMGLKNAPKTDK